ncbi:MAG: C10 family peptidase [bacterium]|nr:C10 family peptidase [bacterium]
MKMQLLRWLRDASLCGVALVFCFILNDNSLAAPVSTPQAYTAALSFVCLRFPARPGAAVRSITARGRSALGIARVGRMRGSGGRTIAFLAQLTPRGFVLLRADDELPPLKLYSDTTMFENLPGWARRVVAEELEEELLELLRRRTGGVVRVRSFTGAWQALAGNAGENGAHGTEEWVGAAAVGPLLSTAWDQGDPYNLHMPTVSGAPSGYGGRAPAGCGAIALAQILRYHTKPAQIASDETYTDNNGSCRGTHSASKAGLTPYDWANMPASVTSGSSAVQKNAVAQLIWHCAVALHMDFEANGSGSSTSAAVSALRTLFGYTCDNYVTRSGFSDSAWFAKLSNDINAAKPVEYVITSSEGGHMVVCDGVTGTSQIHLNFGWGTFLPGATAWYDLNSIVAGGSTWTTHGAIFNITPPTSGTAPTVTAFSINNGAASTSTRTVSLNNTCSGSPTEYMASESSSFSGASWLPYSPAPSFTLSSGNGTKTVYFKVRNSFGTSSAAADTITLNESSYPPLVVLRMREKINWAKGGVGSGVVSVAVPTALTSLASFLPSYSEVMRISADGTQWLLCPSGEFIKADKNYTKLVYFSKSGASFRKTVMRLAGGYLFITRTHANALNREFGYQVTSAGTAGWQQKTVYVRVNFSGVQGEGTHTITYKTVDGLVTTIK